MPAEDQLGTELQTTTGGRKRSQRPDGSLYSSDPKERYQQLVEDGKIGPQFGKLGGRPRKPRAAEAMAEYAKQKTDEMKAAFDAALEQKDDNPRLAMEAARGLIEIERGETQLQHEEEKLDNMSREQLENELFTLLGNPAIIAALEPTTQ
jgi:hypothetical protein